MEKSHSRLLGKLNLESTLSKAFLLMRLIDSEHQLYDNCHLDLPKLLTGNNKLVDLRLFSRGWLDNDSDGSRPSFYVPNN